MVWSTHCECLPFHDIFLVLWTHQWDTYVSLQWTAELLTHSNMLTGMLFNFSCGDEDQLYLIFLSSTAWKKLYKMLVFLKKQRVPPWQQFSTQTSKTSDPNYPALCCCFFFVFLLFVFFLRSKRVSEWKYFLRLNLKQWQKGMMLQL